MFVHYFAWTTYNFHTNVKWKVVIAHYNIHVDTYEIRNEETKEATENLFEPIVAELTKTLF